MWYASDPVAARLAEAQFSLGDGPCQEALGSFAPVFASDLSQGTDLRRWPVFAHMATGLGVHALFSLPLGNGGVAFGTLDLYRKRAGTLSPDDTRTALMAADAVAFSVLTVANGAADADPEGVASWVEAAEADRDEVHQAVGMVMVQLGVDPQQALDRLRAHAFRDGSTVTDVARDVVARRLRLTRYDSQEPEERGPKGGCDQGSGGA
ncbi:GAF and ANTAR domain-containing protein [Streptomyces sp. AN091965]|uniref:GAF and ANTAR domain-containing protein n=1 Tax=Streptomyces sp. AN091965 TaxID=2927803 RepID=UPI001F621002|nr:GAF and ANTAR domain-containing protein [Streptomyces sp. AN091965]MCI3927811.1 GAF and ANTAR domain-containing protein [Streptomyces sp. AN091965]